MAFPQIIQGGMGVAVSSWRLARAVSEAGELGVVSGTALDVVLTRRLQLGDPGGHIRLAFDNFPIPAMAERIWDRYFVEGGKPESRPFKSRPLAAQVPRRDLQELTVVANFTEVFLAKLGHSGVVGINLLEKIQLPTLPSLFGAMLAGVDYVLMGAGIPRAIPGLLDRLANMEPVELKLDVAGSESGEEFVTRFEPRAFAPEGLECLQRPKFLAIVSSSTLAMSLAKKSSGKVDGFVVEGPTAGGHNAPPRGPLTLSEAGEPVYGVRDVPELSEIAKLGLPFWLAGSYAGPSRLREALDAGATGIQVGTAFAFCEESGIEPALKSEILQQARCSSVEVHTDPYASPTGFPFKVVQLPGTLSEHEVQEMRERVCDLGYLRQLYRKPDGTLGYRCPAEPENDYVAKGGDAKDCAGRQCICNGLLATIDLAQIRKDGRKEPPIVTAGDEAAQLSKFLRPGENSYRAMDVIRFLKQEPALV